MQKVTGYNFYRLAILIHPLTELKHGIKLNEILSLLFYAKQWLRFLSNDQLIPLVVSKEAINKLFWTIEGVLPDNTDWSKLSFDVEIDPAWIENVRQQTIDFETVFAAELNSISTYFVSPQLAYDTRTLIESADRLFPEDIRKELPKMTIDDIQQAGRCIAFDIPTAAAFHIIRATETVIRQYYEKVVGKTPKIRMRNWGAYIRKLHACGADQKVTGFLDHIRQTYRNPILHPEIMLESQQVHVLLGVCVSAILQMTEAMKKISV